jgi:hypothetical protein
MTDRLSVLMDLPILAFGLCCLVGIRALCTVEALSQGEDECRF